MRATVRTDPVTALLGGLLTALVTGLLVVAAPAQAEVTPGGRLVSERPAAGTPHVLDGRVLSVARVGDTVIVGGTFSLVSDHTGDRTVERRNLLAFDAATGRIRQGFDPAPNGTVESVIAGGDGTVYVGGMFTSIAGESRERVARIAVADGSLITAFDAGEVTGRVQDLHLADRRLWVAGEFTHIDGRRQPALAALGPATGAPQAFMDLEVAGTHNGGTTQVLEIDVTPNGRRLVAVGNFASLAGLRRHQVLQLDLTGAAARPARFATEFFSPPCSRRFDTYLRDVDFAPDGSFFVIGTTGAYGGPTGPCDTISRWETSSGSGATPSWVDYSGGDTTTAVEVTRHVVYVGGHQRWWNNPFAGDAAGPGAVSREGIAAVSPLNGIPFSWDPTRTKGVGVFDFLSTRGGLWVVSDTDRIGDLPRGRVARFAPDGVRFPATATPRLPATLYVGRSAGLRKRSFDGTRIGRSRAARGGGVDWGAVRGAFLLGRSLYIADDTGGFTRRTFAGGRLGPASPVSTADRIAPLTAWRDDILAMTGMFYDRGRIYFTRTDSDQLFYRYFNPQSRIVGAHRLVASGPVADFRPQEVRGLLLGGDDLFWATADGTVRRADWVRSHQAGAPARLQARIAGPSSGGRGWAAGVVFLGPPAVADAPIGLRPVALSLLAPEG